MDRFFTLELIIRLAASFVGAGAFSVVFKVNRRHVLFGALNGLITYFVYYTVFFFSESFFGAAFVSTAFAAAFSELMARIHRAPTSVFLIPGVIPTVPGSNLYLFMRGILVSDMSEATEQLLITLSIALGIALGAVVVSTVWRTVHHKIKGKKTKRA